ncbi:ABC transporter substrate-binding protein [Streptomyces sp. NPDC017993]|uniref:ABC transporter substrate-binding protein n=1 Tax=Streptomyces sp. NPDC017993 TaxID=3365027 RepID=UPI0037AC5C9B
MTRASARARVMAWCTAVSLLAAGCGAAQQAGAAGGDTFSFAIKGDPGLLDPAQVRNTNTYTALSLAYDTLIHITQDGKVVSGLARKWQVRPSSVTFTLRRDVTCADGSRVTPGTIAENVRHLTDPATKSPTLGVTVPEGLTAKADTPTNRVTLSTPKPFGFILESTRFLFMVCGKGLKDRSVLAHATSGSGPFELSSAKPNQRYTFIRRKHYAWGPKGAGNNDPRMPGKFDLKVVPSEQTAANMMISNQLNGVMLNGPDRSRMQKIPGVTTTEQSIGPSEFFFHQGQEHPGQDPALRRALLQAVDLRQLGAIASSGTGRKATGLVQSPRPCPGDTVSGNLPTFHHATAEKALDDAGWRRSGSGVRTKDGKRLNIRMVYGASSGEAATAAAEYLAKAWQDVGVQVQLRGVVDAAYADVESVTQDWDVIWEPLGVTLPTQLLGMLSGPFTPDGSNFAHLTNKRYEQLTAQAGRRPGAAGCTRWRGSERALLRSGDVVPVVDRTATIAARNSTFQMTSGMFEPTSIRMTGGRR